MKKTASNFLGFRLSEDLIEKLDLIAKQKAKTRGLTAKNAIEQWVNYEMFNQTNQMIILPKSLINELFKSYVNEEKLQVLIKEITNLIADIMKFAVSKPMTEEHLEIYLRYSIYLFGSSGLNWFNSLDISINDESFTLMGLHDLNEQFSNFFALFYKYLLQDHFGYGLTVNREEKTSNLIHLEFTLKKLKT